MAIFIWELALTTMREKKEIDCSQNLAEKISYQYGDKKEMHFTQQTITNTSWTTYFYIKFNTSTIFKENIDRCLYQIGLGQNFLEKVQKD